MSNKSVNWVLYGTILGVLLGALAGYYAPLFMQSIDFMGQLFFNALRLIVFPLIIISLIMVITTLGNARKVGQTTLSTLVYFLVTSIAAVAVGLVLVYLIRPGVGISSAGTYLPGFLHDLRTSSLADFVSGLIPANIPQAILSGNYAGIVLLSIIVGLVLASMGKQAKLIVDFVKSLNEMLFKIIRLVLFVAPVGLFILVGNHVAQASGTDAISNLVTSLSMLVLVVLAGFIIHGVVILPLVMKIFGKSSPLAMFSSMLPALSTALGSGSSAAALSVTSYCALERSKIDRRACQYVLPLGAFLNVGGTAMYAIIAAVFTAQMFDISLSAGQVATMALVAGIASFGISGVPHAGLFLVTLLMGVGNFPNEAYGVIGLLFGVDWLFTRLCATLNVWSDSIGAAVVAETFEFKTARHAPSRTTSYRRERVDPKKRGQRTPVSRGKEKREQTDRHRTPRGERPGRRRNGEEKQRSRRTERPLASKANDNKISRRVPSKVKGEKPFKESLTTEKKTQSPFTISDIEVSTIEPKKQPVSRNHKSRESTRPRKSFNIHQPPRQPVKDKPTEEKQQPGDPDKVTSTGKNKESVPSGTLERELSRVAARLAALDDTHQDTPESEPQKNLDTRPPETDKTDKNPSNDDLPKVDFLAAMEESDKTPVEAENDSSTETQNEVNEESQPDSAPQDFGIRNRRSGSKEQPVENEDVDKEPVTESVEDREYSLEKQTFGRTKKRRIR